MPPSPQSFSCLEQSTFDLVEAGVNLASRAEIRSLVLAMPDT